ncbi:MAG TPA: F0F1 ATP synthase subunit B [Acidimicrobiales bacterium]|nr:F0F1 ATP synthase subunit B [Acidimicrobiales bacterium]
MRIRNAIVASLVVVLATAGLAGPAGAAESIGSCVAGVALEAEELRAQGLSDSEIEKELEAQAEACVEAPNPVLPEPTEIIWIGISFTLLMVLGYKFAWPGIAKTMSDRTERIRTELEAAERARAEASEATASHDAQLAEARAEASRIVEEARSAAESVRADRIAAAEVEAAAIRERAAAEAEQARSQALADLRSDVAALAVGAAEQVVQRSLDAEAQSELIENYINQVGSGR